ncbi:APC family permease [Heyndrickxia acidicola]|uniref:Amino acid permease n=1 Tax=Heyndrickxia acidicola TaxID=209389 RepID=A0ABU6MLY9_9BACI|nr:amino acid permease [Heyndrickxia acidicola]MED1205705.1 amino acid permease [Heyndrickxia acidicola]
MSKEKHSINEDVADLASLGYTQELKRNLNFFSNFAISFSFISATTGIFSLFGFGLTTGGPAFIWSWPIVFIGQLLVGLTMGEVASHYPVAGSIYQWTKHLAGNTYSWFSGWIYLIALLATIASVDFGAAPYIAQLMGMDANNHVLLVLITAVIVILQTLINAFSVKLMAIINGIGMIAEIVAMIVLAIALFAVGIHHPFSFSFDTAGTAGKGSYLPVFLAAMLTSTWVLFGFDSAGSLAEEVINPRRVVPKAIISSLFLTFIIGGLALLAFVLAIPNLGETMKAAVPLTYILNKNLGTGISNAFVVLALIAIFVCGTAVQATVSRLLFSFGRDNKIPGAKLWAKMSKKHDTPVAAIIFSGIFAILLVLSSSAESYIVNICVVGIYLAYLSVTVGALFARTRGWDSTASPWNLGKWGLTVNILSLIWGVFVILNLCWPRSPGQAWYLNYSVPLLAVIVMLIGAVYYFSSVYPRDKAITLKGNSEPFSNHKN